MQKHWGEVGMCNWAGVQEKLNQYENLRSQTVSFGQKHEPSN